MYIGVFDNGPTEVDAYIGTLSSSQITIIPSLGGDVTGAFGLNNLGQVVGTSRNSNPDILTEAYLYDHGTILPLGDLGGGSTANAINDFSVIVGDAGLSKTGPAHAFVYDAAHGMRDIDGRDASLQSLDSVAVDINNAGTIVGDANRADGSWRAALFDETTGVHFLDDLIPPNSGWDFLFQATDINNLGQIVGTGQIDGESHVFLLTPTPEPASITLALLAAAPILVLARRKRIIAP
jgi:probable HAF family extracellular repeat protein